MPKFLRHVQFPPHPPAIPTPLRHTHSPLSGAREGHVSRGLIPLTHTIKSLQTFFFFNENKLDPSTKWKRCFSHMLLLWCKIYLKQYYIITVWQHPFQTWHQEKIKDSTCSKDNQKKDKRQQPDNSAQPDNKWHCLPPESLRRRHVTY